MRYLLVLSVLLLTSAASAQTVTTFTAELDFTTVRLGGVSAPAFPATASATFVLSEPATGGMGEPTVSYSIQLEGLDLDGFQSSSLDDNVTAIHVHDITDNIAANGGSKVDVNTGGTQHVLNIFGVPRDGDDDDDLVTDPVAGTLSGLWEDSDAVSNPMMSLGDTFAVSAPDVIDRLKAGNYYLMIHTSNSAPGVLPGGITIGGFLTAVPEPNAVVLGLLAIGWIGTKRRK
ncbi:MAG: CHRD domain-containing protein [Lacipirellulaceae bacterium]